jgi:hypothetical protein
VRIFNTNFIAAFIAFFSKQIQTQQGQNGSQIVNSRGILVDPSETDPVMARYSKDYSGEKRTEKVTVQLSPSERATLEKGAERGGVSLSQHTREQSLRRSTAPPSPSAGPRRSPDARALLRELIAIGNNLNQLTKLSNTGKTAPQYHELKATTDLVKTAISHVIGA